MSDIYKSQKKYTKDLSYKVVEEAHLLQWLLKNVNTISKTKIKSLLKRGAIFVDGKRITQYDKPLTIGTQITIKRNIKASDLFKSKYIKIVYEDKYIVVIEKNIGILSMAAGHSSLNVKSILDDYFQKSKQKCRAHVVHRLDRDTSGLMIYAKDMQTEQILEHYWHDIVFDRRYVAVLSGEIVEEGGTIKNWLKDNNAYFTYSSETDNGGKFAVTHFHVLKRTINHSLVEFKLDTGRKNQIRVHSADIGHPVCGDIKYGNGDNPIGRLCLHAYMLHMYHPITKNILEFNTNIPSVFNKIFK